MNDPNSDSADTNKSEASHTETISPALDLSKPKPSAEVREKLNPSSHTVDFYWGFLWLCTVASFVGAVGMGCNLHRDLATYRMLTSSVAYAPGMDAGIVRFSGQPTFHDLSESQREIQDSLTAPNLVYAHVEASHKKGSRIGRNKKKVVDFEETFDLRNNLRLKNGDSTALLRPGATEYISHRSMNLASGLLKQFSVHFPKVDASTGVHVRIFDPSTVTVYGRPTTASDGSVTIAPTDGGRLLLASLPHETLLREYLTACLASAFGLLAFLVSGFHIWMGRRLKKYLAEKERYWIFDKTGGPETTGLTVLVLYIIVVIGVWLLVDTEPVFRTAQGAGVAFVFFCLLLNRLKALEYFYVGDVQTNRLLEVSISLTRTSVVEMAELNKLELREVVRSVEEKGRTSHHYTLMGKVPLLSSPEARARHSEGTFNESLSEESLESTQSLKESFERWSGG